MSSKTENDSQFIAQIGDRQITEVNKSTATGLNFAIAIYPTALEAIETADSHPSEKQVLEVLVAQDTVSVALNQENKSSSPRFSIPPHFKNSPKIARVNLFATLGYETDRSDCRF